MVYVEETRRLPHSQCEHTISGNFEDVLDGIRKVVSTYHPMGYGTAVVSMTYRSEPDGSKWVAVVKRSNSCD